MKWVCVAKHDDTEATGVAVVGWTATVVIMLAGRRVARWKRLVTLR